MYSDRPRIKVPYQSIDIIIELLSITLLLVIGIYTLSAYANLPETIPTHFNLNGKADDFGSKTFVFLLPAIAIVVYIGLFAANKFPHLHNYMVNITEENALKNYRFSSRVLRLVNFLCTILFAYLTYVIIENAKGIETGLGPWFLPIIIGFSILLPIVLVVYMKKLNR